MSQGNEEEQCRKLFIGGISLETTDEGLKEYFDKFGKTLDCVVIREPGTQRSRGFGFVTYETEEEADKCMANRPHFLNGRSIDAKRAVSREESSKPGAHIQVKKVFVGGVKQGCDEATLRDYFSSFGSVLSVDIPLDRESQQPKGYGFVTFDDVDVIDKLVSKRHHEVGGFQLEVKKALSKDELEKSKQQLNMKQQHSGPARSGRGGGRGRGRSRGGGGGDGYYNDSYSSGGPMRGQYGQSQRSGGPYGSGYGSSGGSYGSNSDYYSGGNYGSYGYGSGASGGSEYDSSYNGYRYEGYGGSSTGYGGSSSSTGSSGYGNYNYGGSNQSYY